MQLGRFPRFPLAHLPTPLEPLGRLRAHLGGPRLLIKRDDCTGLALGGNKTRKLEFLIADALAQGATTVVTEGGMQSNHVRQTAAAAVRAGLKCDLVLDRSVPWSDPAYDVSGNLFLDRLLAARLHLCDPGEGRAERAPKVIEALRAQGERPYHVPTGGSNGIGGLGFVQCALEILEQARQQDMAVDHVVVASGSGGTQGGLLAGLLGANSGATAIGIDIDAEPEVVRGKVAAVARDTARLLNIEGAITEADLDVRAGYAAPGYGMPNPGMIEAVELLARLEGILLDPVYSGKAMAGLIDLIRQGAFDKEETLVFIHTGGTPALFAYTSAFAAN